jgi:GNAT superfamily N-acetyltransferase
MPIAVTLVPASRVDALRARHRAEARCQIVHDSLHTRAGWTKTYLLEIDSANAGFIGVAVGGPWRGKPTVFEMYVLPEHRGRAFALFEAFLATGAAGHFEVQTSDALLAVMLHTYARDIISEKIVFKDALTTNLAANGAMLKRTNSEQESMAAFRERAGGSEWALEVEGRTAATGGILFHYNYPYGDIYMEVVEDFRRRGLGAYLVQELKRVTYEMGGIPAARCNPDNIPSRRTLQKAGLVPYAHILLGTITVTENL